jgi:hypothetical protein
MELEKLDFCPVIPVIKKKYGLCLDCETWASYNVEGETKKLYCFTHKKEGMIDVKSKKCLECKSRPYFNVDGETTGIYCDKHKKENMVNVVSKTCLECKSRPSFNVEGETTGIYCDKHKKENMVNVVSPRCLECKSRPGFNVEGEKTAIYCVKHKKENMVNVVNKTCLECKSQPHFNVDGETTAIYCAKHKKENMVNVVNKTCLECKSQPNFNVEGETIGIYCAKHKKDGMIDVKHKICKTHLCSTIISNDKYDGYCLRCFIHLFPDKPVSRNYKTKEQATVEFIKQQFPDKTWITDKKISGGCSKRRPDLLMDYGEQIIIIEIDENQHKSYDDCYNKRIMEISQDLGHRPVIFIRFNPDDYFDKNKTKINSCWSITRKTGIIKICDKTKWEKRLNVLKKQVQYWIENKTEKTVETVHLFYDENL